MDGLNDNGLAAIGKGMNSAFCLSPLALFAPLFAVCCIPSASSGNAALDNGLSRTYSGCVTTPGVPETIQEPVEKMIKLHRGLAKAKSQAKKDAIQSEIEETDQRTHCLT
jgi:hypothetical protein